MPRFTFDVRTYLTVPVEAETELQAREMLLAAFGDYEANFGAWPNGDPILGNGGGFCEAPQLIPNGEEVYHIYSDYGYADQRLIASLHTLAEARQWLELEVDYRNSASTFRTLEVISFADDGEALIYERWTDEE